MNRRIKIAISFFEGRIHRDLIENDFISICNRECIDIIFYSPVVHVKKYIDKFQNIENVNFRDLKISTPTKVEYRLNYIMSWLRKHFPTLLPTWDEFQKLFYKENEYFQLLAQDDIDLLILTNPMQYYEKKIFNAAVKLGIPTLGLVRSWDNFYKNFWLRPNYLAVWNEINKKEALKLLKYRTEQVFIIGSLQFDLYIKFDEHLVRKEFTNLIGFDSTDPIITIATLGSFIDGYDETYLLDLLIGWRSDGKLPQKTQIICRLHPSTKLEYFAEYGIYDFVYISCTKKYIPTLTWTMDRADIIESINILRHSDVVISPGSTITLETSIFDTPTIVPIFHTYQPTRGKEQFDSHLSKHYKKLVEEKLIDIAQNPDELLIKINKYLSNGLLFQNERNQIFNSYIPSHDGHSVNRLVTLIKKISVMYE